MSSPVDARYDIRYPRGRSPVRHRARVRAALVPASWLYRSVADAVARVQCAGRDVSAHGATVVSVGNIEVGGNGKTPFCLYLLEGLVRRGVPAAYVSRGYGGRAGRIDAVTRVGEAARPRPGTRWLPLAHPDLAREVGDEGAVVAARVPGAVLAFSRDKARAVEEACEDVGGGGVVVLDDAFQSWRVARDVDIVLVDARRPFGDGWLLPAGTLREEPAALERADLVLFNGASTSDDVARAREAVRRSTGVDVFCSGLRRAIALERRVEGPVVALSAVARPEAFEAMLVDAGCDIALALRYPDHFAYAAADVAAIRRAAAERGGAVVVTTEKDRVKLDALGMDARERVVARLEVEPTDASVVWKHVEPRT